VALFFVHFYAKYLLIFKIISLAHFADNNLQ